MRLAPTAPSRQFIERSITIRAALRIKQWGRRRIRRRALLSLIACAAAHPAIATKPVIYDTGYEIFHKIVLPSIYWIDNERLLFEGIKTSDRIAAVASRDRERIRRLTKIYLWEKKTASIRTYAEGSSLCVAKGVVHYTVGVNKATGQRTERVGPMGRETERDSREPAGKYAGEMVHGHLICKLIRRNALVPSPQHDRDVVILKDEIRYVDLGPNIGADLALRRSSPKNLILYQGSTQEPVRLSFTWDESFSPFDVAYSDYLGAYLLRPRAPRGSPIGSRQLWPKNEPLIVYMLWPDGRWDTAHIPYSPTEYLTNPRPVRAGWIFGGGNFYKAAGLYLFDRTSVIKLDAGLVKEIAVSPDGCTVAVAIQNIHLRMGTPTLLRIIELCGGIQ